MNFKPKAQKSELVVLAWVKGKDMKEFHFHRVTFGNKNISKIKYSPLLSSLTFCQNGVL